MTQLFTQNGAAVLPIAFGTMQFGGTADEAASRAMFEACAEAGISHFDTAHVYTGGQSETLLGQMVAQDPGTYFVASKVGYTGGAGARNMRSQFDLSRKRLARDTVDLLYLHRFDPDTDLRETLETFAALKQDGLIRYVGLSNFAAWQVMKAIRVAAECDLNIDCLQPMYSVVKRQAEVEILPMCADQGVTAIPYSPLGGGLLTGKYSAGGSGRLTEDTRYAARYDPDWMHATAHDLTALAETAGVHPATLAVAWVARHPARPCPIISARSVAQLAPSLRAVGYDMDDALYAAISPPRPRDRPAGGTIDDRLSGDQWRHRRNLGRRAAVRAGSYRRARGGERVGIPRVGPVCRAL